MGEERWLVVRATTHFDQLLDQVITTRQPVFIEGERRNAVLISMVEWESIQAKHRLSKLRLQASKDAMDLGNHPHRCIFDRSFITA
jgi:PHD/YefM family antitoxin component YafN of YafNO toxin-antitoxin module